VVWPPYHTTGIPASSLQSTQTSNHHSVCFLPFGFFVGTFTLGSQASPLPKQRKKDVSGTKLFPSLGPPRPNAIPIPGTSDGLTRMNSFPDS
jgi:hypothetical protein